MLYTEVLERLESDEHLEHFGTKGMRWGQRKQQETSGSTNGSNRQLPKISNRAKVELGVGAAALVLGIVGAKKYKDTAKQLEEMTWRAKTYGKDANDSRKLLDRLNIPGYSGAAPTLWHIPN